MIRTVGNGRLGVVTMGNGGSAGDYSFDPETGLSKDPRLAYYLQDLTPAQLQTALDGRDPSGDVRALLTQERTGTGAGRLPCGNGPGDPCGPLDAGIGGFINEHSTAIVIGGSVLLFLLVVRR